MKTDLDLKVESDVKRVETAMSQDVDLARWRIWNVARMQQAQHQIDAALLIAIPVIFILIILVVFYSGHP